MVPIGAGRHADQFGEATAERAQRRAADRETDLGDAEVATTQPGTAEPTLDLTDAGVADIALLLVILGTALGGPLTTALGPRATLGGSGLATVVLGAVACVLLLARRRNQ